MRLKNSKRIRISMLILLVSAGSWGLIMFNPGGNMTIQHCPQVAFCPAPSVVPTRASMDLLLALNPISSLLAGWGLMLAAMMLPTLISPVTHIVERSFKRRAARSVGLFILAYAAVWMLVGMAMIAVILLMKLLMAQSYLPAIGVGTIALVWLCSPAFQRCLNRRHNHWELSAFGRRADGDALRFGAMHGVWCVGSCWALMLFPMLLPQGHNLAMLVVTYMMVSFHLADPEVPRWRIRFPLKLMRIVVGQTKIHTQRVFRSS